jgi:hypothetical protein
MNRSRLRIALNAATAVIAGVLLLMGGCSSTTTSQLSPSPQAPVCRPEANSLILWGTQWRADQKDVLSREAAAAEGLAQFVAKSGCFKSAALQRVNQTSGALTQSAALAAFDRYDQVVLITVRELGPTLKVGASLALIEGGTEVVFEVSEYTPQRSAPRAFTAHWRSGGPGVLKGTASMSLDMQAALTAALQPPAR